LGAILFFFYLVLGSNANRINLMFNGQNIENKQKYWENVKKSSMQNKKTKKGNKIKKNIKKWGKKSMIIIYWSNYNENIQTHRDWMINTISIKIIAKKKHDQIKKEKSMKKNKK